MAIDRGGSTYKPKAKPKKKKKQQESRRDERRSGASRAQASVKKSSEKNSKSKVKQHYGEVARKTMSGAIKANSTSKVGKISEGVVGAPLGSFAVHTAKNATDLAKFGSRTAYTAKETQGKERTKVTTRNDRRNETQQALAEKRLQEQRELRKKLNSADYKKGKKEYVEPFKKASNKLGEKQDKILESGAKALGLSDKKTHDTPDIPILGNLLGIESGEEQRKRATKELLKKNGLDKKSIAGNVGSQLKDLDKYAKENGINDDTVLTNGMTYAEYRKKMEEDLYADYYNQRKSAKKTISKKLDEEGVGKFSNADIYKGANKLADELADYMIPYVGTTGKALKGAESILRTTKGGKAALTVGERAAKGVSESGKKFIKESLEKGFREGKSVDDILEGIAKKTKSSDFKFNIKKEALANAMQDATVGTAIDYAKGRQQGLEGKELAKYMGTNAVFNAGFGAPVSLVAGRTGKAGKKALTQDIKASINNSMLEVNKMTVPEASELLKLQRKSDAVGLNAGETARLSELENKVKTQVSGIAQIDVNGKLVANDGGTVKVFASENEIGRLASLEAKQSVGVSLTPSELGEYASLKNKIGGAYEAVQQNAVRTMAFAKTLPEYVDLSNMESGVNYAKLTGDDALVKQMKDAHINVVKKQFNADNVSAKLIASTNEQSNGGLLVRPLDEEARANLGLEDGGAFNFVDAKTGQTTIYIDPKATTRKQKRYTLAHEFGHQIVKVEGDKSLVNTIKSMDSAEWDKMKSKIEGIYKEQEKKEAQKGVDTRVKVNIDIDEEVACELFAKKMGKEDIFAYIAGDNPSVFNKLRTYFGNRMKGDPDFAKDADLKDLADRFKEAHEASLHPQIGDVIDDAMMGTVKYRLESDFGGGYAPKFYSKMYQVVDKRLGKGKRIGANVHDIHQFFMKKGCTADEWKFSGMEQFLEGKKSVTKEELLDYLRANSLELEEIRLEDTPRTRPENSYDEREYDYSDTYWDEPPEGYYPDDVDVPEWAYEPKSDGETQYAEYVLPNGSNYREILYKMPSGRAAHYESPHWEQEGVVLHSRIQDFHVGDGVLERRGLSNSEIESLRSRINHYLVHGGEVGEIGRLPINDDYYFYATDLAKVADGYYVGIFSQKTSEEVASITGGIDTIDDFIRDSLRDNLEYGGYRQGNGDSVLFIDEIQSDLHNDGAQYGYITDAQIKESKRRHAEAIKKSADLKAQMQKETNLTEYSKLEKQYHAVNKEADNLLEQLRDLDANAPDAPYSNGAYVDYALKNAIREACENGQKYVAWTTAEQQAKRWSNDFIKAYTNEYDTRMVNFMNKYVQQFNPNAKVEKITIAENGMEVWGIEIPENMRDSVLYEGQGSFMLVGDHADAGVKGISKRVGDKIMKTQLNETKVNGGQNARKKLGKIISLQLEHGASNDDIIKTINDFRQKTGWFLLPDGHMAFEISDSASKFRMQLVPRKKAFTEEMRNRAGDLRLKKEKAKGLTKEEQKELDDLTKAENTNLFNTTGVELKELFDHPELYKAYPKLANCRVVSQDLGEIKPSKTFDGELGGLLGSASRGRPFIRINSRLFTMKKTPAKTSRLVDLEAKSQSGKISEKESKELSTLRNEYACLDLMEKAGFRDGTDFARGVLLHEVQHQIQRIESWTGGFSTKELYGKAIDAKGREPRFSLRTVAKDPKDQPAVENLQKELISKFQNLTPLLEKHGIEPQTFQNAENLAFALDYMESNSLISGIESLPKPAFMLSFFAKLSKYSGLPLQARTDPALVSYLETSYQLSKLARIDVNELHEVYAEVIGEQMAQSTKRRAHMNAQERAETSPIDYSATYRYPDIGGKPSPVSIKDKIKFGSGRRGGNEITDESGKVDFQKFADTYEKPFNDVKKRGGSAKPSLKTGGTKGLSDYVDEVKEAVSKQLDKSSKYGKKGSESVRREAMEKAFNQAYDTRVGTVDWKMFYRLMADNENITTSQANATRNIVRNIYNDITTTTTKTSDSGVEEKRVEKQVSTNERLNQYADSYKETDEVYVPPEEYGSGAPLTEDSAPVHWDEDTTTARPVQKIEQEIKETRDKLKTATSAEKRQQLTQRISKLDKELDDARGVDRAEVEKTIAQYEQDVKNLQTKLKRLRSEENIKKTKNEIQKKKTAITRLKNKINGKLDTIEAEPKVAKKAEEQNAETTAERATESPEQETVTVDDDNVYREDIDTYWDEPTSGYVKDEIERMKKDARARASKKAEQPVEEAPVREQPAEEKPKAKKATTSKGKTEKASAKKPAKKSAESKPAKAEKKAKKKTKKAEQSLEERLEQAEKTVAKTEKRVNDLEKALSVASEGERASIEAKLKSAKRGRTTARSNKTRLENQIAKAKPKPKEVEVKPETPEEALENAKKGYYTSEEIGQHMERLAKDWNEEIEALRAITKAEMSRGKIGRKIKREKTFDEEYEIAVKEREKDFDSMLARVLGREPYVIPTPKAKAEELAVMEELITRSANGDKKATEQILKVEDVSNTNASATGHGLQLQSYILRKSPHGRLRWAVREVNRLNKEYASNLKGKKIELTTEQTEKILSAKTEKEIADTMDEIAKDIWKQIPSGKFEAMNQIRHWAMLFNPKTHARNMGGNAIFWGARQISSNLESTIIQHSTGRIQKLSGEATVEKALKDAEDALKNATTEEEKAELKANIKQLKDSLEEAKAEQKANMGEYVTRQDFTEDTIKLLDERFDVDYKTDGKSGTGRWQESKRSSGYLYEQSGNKAKDAVSKLMNKAIDTNYLLLDLEDRLFFKRAYRKEYVRYCKSKGICEEIDGRKVVTKEVLENMTDAQKQKATAWALQQAKIATYRDESALASRIISWKNASEKMAGTGKPLYRLANIGLESMLPFVKTPINILRRGMDYSPIGLMRGIWDAALAKNVNDFMNGIHYLSTGLTGTGIWAVGIWAAHNGWVTVNAGDVSGDEFYDREMGYQDYSLRWKVLGQEYSVSLDWVAPMQFSFFQGAAIYENLCNGKGFSIPQVLNAIEASFNPLMEMSFMSSTKDNIQSFFERAYYNTDGDEANWIEATARTFFGSIPQGWVSGFVPQLLSQGAGAHDDYIRDTSSTRESIVGMSWESFGRKMQNRIPILREQLMPKVNHKGEDITNKGNNVLTKTLNAFANPANIKKIEMDKYDQAVIDVYNDKDLIEVKDDNRKWLILNLMGNPAFEKSDGTRMTYKEKHDYTAEKRQKQWDSIKTMVDSDSFKNMTPKMKAEEMKNYHYNSTTQADAQVYGYDYARDNILAQDKKGTHEKAVWERAKRLGIGSREYVESYVATQNLKARTHDDGYHTVALALESMKAKQNYVGDKDTKLSKEQIENLEMAYDVWGDKVKPARKYLKQVGDVAKAIKEYSDSYCNGISYCDKHEVSSSKRNVSFGLAHYDNIPERAYRAMGYDWNSAQAGGGLKHYGYTYKKMQDLEMDALIKYDADHNNSLKKAEIIDYIESLGIKSKDKKACLYEYLSGSSSKNPYGQIKDWLRWGDEPLEEDGFGSGGYGGRGYGGRGYGGGGFGSSGGGTMPKTASGAIKGKITNPFSTSNGTSASNLNDAYRKKARKLRKQSQ